MKCAKNDGKKNLPVRSSATLNRKFIVNNSSRSLVEKIGTGQGSKETQSIAKANRLIQIVKNTNNPMLEREKAVRDLSLMGKYSYHITSELVRIITSESNSLARIMMPIALIKIGPPGINSLIKLLGHKNFAVRNSVALAMRSMGNSVFATLKKTEGNASGLQLEMIRNLLRDIKLRIIKTDMANMHGKGWNLDY